MRKYIYILVVLFGCIYPASAQQQYYNWQIGAGVGALTYYGDLSHKINTAQISAPAYRFTLGRTLSPTLSLTLQATYGQITGNDRSKDWNSNLVTDNSNFGRALNFQTDIRSADLLLTYRLNNGRVLSEHAAVAPYFFAGVGATNFTVYGDLFYGDGNRYYYWSDNTVRNLPQSAANQDQAQVIEQDEDYETNLTDLRVEKEYPTTVLNIPVGIGLQFRISDRLTANVQAGAHYAFTGYLDDVSGDYRGEYESDVQAYAANPSGQVREPRGNGKNDAYFSGALTLNYFFNTRRKSFKMPLVYASGDIDPLYTDSDAMETDEADSLAQKPDTATKTIAKITPVPLPPSASPNTASAAPDSTAAASDSRKQTVDVNIRIFVEGAGGSRDSITIRTDTSQYTVQPPALNRRFLPDSSAMDTTINLAPTNSFIRSSANTARISALERQIAALKADSLNRFTADTLGTDSVATGRTLRTTSPSVDSTSGISNASQPDTTSRRDAVRAEADQNETPEDDRRVRQLEAELATMQTQLKQLQAQRDTVRARANEENEEPGSDKPASDERPNRVTRPDSLPTQTTSRRNRRSRTQPEEENVIQMEEDDFEQPTEEENENAQKSPDNRTSRNTAQNQSAPIDSSNRRTAVAPASSDADIQALSNQIDALTTEVRTLRARRDTSRTVSPSASPANTRPATTATNQQTAPAPANARTAQLEQEVQYLRSSLDEQRRQTAALQNQQRDYQRRLAVNPVIQVPLGANNNRYDRREMEALRSDMAEIKKQLSANQSGNKRDTAVVAQIDSLTKRIDSLNQANASLRRAAATPDTDNAQALQENQAQNGNVIAAMRREIAQLNQSLAEMEYEKLTNQPTATNAPNIAELDGTAVYFASNSADFNPADTQRLAIIATQLKQRTNLLLNIKGYTDATGNPTNNLRLSRQRAENVKNYFVTEQGIDANRILINYYGQQAVGASARRADPSARRVELELYQR